MRLHFGVDRMMEAASPS